MCRPSWLPLLLLAAITSYPNFTTAKTIPIRSTANAPFFNPVNTTADVGDILEFHFQAHNRSVVMGSFTGTPCQPISTGGFFSGFFIENDTTTENPIVFRVTVNDTSPILYYCSQDTVELGNHCQQGMAGAVNQPDLSKLQAYKDAAAATNVTVTPAGGVPFGGVFAANPDSNETSNSSNSGGDDDKSDGRKGRVGAARMMVIIGFAMLVVL